MLSAEEVFCEERWTPGSSPGVTWRRLRRQNYYRSPLRRQSRLGRKPEPSGGLERLDVEGADLDRAAYIERHRDAVLGHGRGDDARALRQQRGDVRRRASLRLENAIADDADDRSDREERGGAGDQHQPPHLRDDAGGRGIEGRFIVRREL